MGLEAFRPLAPIIGAWRCCLFRARGFINTVAPLNSCVTIILLYNYTQYCFGPTSITVVEALDASSLFQPAISLWRCVRYCSTRLAQIQL